MNPNWIIFIPEILKAFEMNHENWNFKSDATCNGKQFFKSFRLLWEALVLSIFQRHVMGKYIFPVHWQHQLSWVCCVKLVNVHYACKAAFGNLRFNWKIIQQNDCWNSIFRSIFLSMRFPFKIGKYFRASSFPSVQFVYVNKSIK